METTRFGATIVVEYAYDAEGNRVRKTIDGTVVINYLVDTNRDYAQVLEERDGNGNLLARYVYGHDLISQTRGGATSYYHYDDLGSTRALTNSSAVVTDTYVYDAFGVVLEQNGATRNDYLYRGEQFDAELGFYYLRARYMDPDDGRFVTMDVFAGHRSDPYSLHKYLYANANPISYYDPSGYSPLSEFMSSSAIQGILSKMSCFAMTAARRTLIGGVFAGVVGGIDSWLRDESIIDGMVQGGKAGATFGALSTVKVLEPVLMYLGFKSVIGGIKEAVQQEDYKLAAFRSSVLMVMAYGTLSKYWQRVCFTEDTLIYTKEGYKPIKEIAVSDEVYSENMETGENGLKQVEQVFIRETTVLIHIIVQEIEIKVTPEHPFWVVGKGWVAAGQLHPDDELRLYSGNTEKITSVQKEVLTHPITVYNFTVEGWHTYAVSEQKILVHNAKYVEQIPQFVKSLKTVTKYLDCKELSKIVLRTFAPKGKVVIMSAKRGGVLPTQGDLPKNWDNHAASMFPDGHVYDPLLELPFPSVEAWKNFVVGPNDVVMESGSPGSKMSYQLIDGTFRKM